MILLLGLGNAVSVTAQSVEFDITQQDIIAEVLSDGGVKFTDEQYYNVTFMNGAIFKLDHKGYDLGAYKVSVRNEATGQVEVMTESRSQISGTYTVTPLGMGLTEFKVYRPTTKERVTFIYEYTLKGLVTNYRDTAELNRKLVGSETDYWMDVNATIILPSLVSNADDFRAWGHGAPQGSVALEVENNRSVVKLSIKDNPANQFVEVHTIFPTSMTPNNKNIVDKEAKEAIIAEEEEQIKADLSAIEHQKRMRMLSGAVIVATIPIMPLLAIWYYVKQYRKLNPNPVKLPIHNYELPADISPAVMASAVLRSVPNGEDFAATILDLARKGYIEIQEVRREKRGLFNAGSHTVLIMPVTQTPDINLLQKHEQRVLSYVTPSDEAMTLEQIEDMIRQDTSFWKQQDRLWSGFQNSASAKGTRLSQPATTQRRLSRGLMVISAIIVITSSVIGIVYSGLSRNHLLGWTSIGLGLTGLVASVVGYLFARFRPIRSAKEDVMRQEWEGFANMLRDVGQFDMREIASLELWEEYLVYAVSLGVADKVLESMKVQFTQTELMALNNGRGTVITPYFIEHSVASPSRIYSPPISSGSYSGSNSGGFGGGFSGGSSGGSGGGSGSGGF